MRLGTCGYYADFLGAALASAALCLHAMSTGGWLVRAEWLTCLLIGICLWTLLEYAIHRWLYHSVQLFIPFHEAHHEKPNLYVGAPPLLGIGLIFLMIFLPLASVSFTMASGLAAGTLAGYMIYQLVHHANHFWRPARGGYLYWARLHHSAHHYHGEVGNFGITTDFWDRVFGTAIAKRRPTRWVRPLVVPPPTTSPEPPLGRRPQKGSNLAAT